MKFASDVMDLMGAYPGREWRMLQIVRHIAQGRKVTLKERRAIRKGVHRVLDALTDAGTVTVRPETSKGGPAWYAWKK